MGIDFFFFFFYIEIDPPKNLHVDSGHTADTQDGGKYQTFTIPSSKSFIHVLRKFAQAAAPQNTNLFSLPSLEHPTHSFIAHILIGHSCNLSRARLFGN